MRRRYKCQTLKKEIVCVELCFKLQEIFSESFAMRRKKAVDLVDRGCNTNLWVTFTFHT